MAIVALWYEEGRELGEATLVELAVEFAFVAAVGGVGFEDVAVAATQLLVDGGLLDGAGADVVA